MHAPKIPHSTHRLRDGVIVEITAIPQSDRVNLSIGVGNTIDLDFTVYHDEIVIVCRAFLGALKCLPPPTPFQHLPRDEKRSPLPPKPPTS